jgi:hypothetical protein
MSKVEDGGAIPKSGQECPKSEALEATSGGSDYTQTVDNEVDMSLEMALVRALHELGKPPDET